MLGPEVIWWAGAALLALVVGTGAGWLLARSHHRRALLAGQQLARSPPLSQPAEEQFARLAESISDYLWSAQARPGGAFSYRYFSPVVARITGRPREYYLADGLDVWYATIDPQDLAPVQAGLQRLVGGELDRLDMEYRIRRPDGGLRWLRDSMHATRLADGQLLLDGVVSDITERKLAEEALRESEERFRSLTELSSDWYWRQDENLRFNYLSSQAMDLTGYTGESSYGKARWELLNMWPLSGSWDEHKAVLAARLPFRNLECCRMGPDGVARYLSMTGAPLFDEAGRFRGYHGIGRNITEQKRIEGELRARQEMLDLAQKAAQAAAFEWHLGTLRGHPRWSPDLESMLGIAPGEYDGTFEGWRKLVHPDDRAAADRAIREARAVGDVSFEYRVVHPDGSLHWLQLKARIDANDAANERLVGFMLDVTDRHKAEQELQRLERQLRQAQRLEAMGTLAGGIAHDFNNILGAILGYGEMALRAAPKGGRLHHAVANVMVAGERGRALVEQILTFSRSGASERIAVHVEHVVEEALDQVKARVPRGVAVDAQMQAGAAAVIGDATQVHQVAMNLMTNALQAMPGGGTIRVRLGVLELPARRHMTTGTLPAGDYVVLEVGDSGTGIEPEIVDRIFDPFFTTKKPGFGTGLGLSLVHSIVGQLGGSINVASEPGGGSTFTVYLPRAQDALVPEEDEEPDAPRGNGERVMVVDDEQPLMLIATETLEDYGYRAVGFTSSQAALEALRRKPDAFDVVVTDERMPGVTGATLLQQVRTLRPGIPTVLMSGYFGVEAAADMQGVADVVLKKPLSGRELAAGVADVLQKATTAVKT